VFPLLDCNRGISLSFQFPAPRPFADRVKRNRAKERGGRGESKAFFVCAVFGGETDMAENDEGRQDDNASGHRHSGGRKKALIVSVLLFLLFGGGIFLFFVIQGADDLKDNKTRNFSYGSEARAGVSAFMKYLSFTSDEVEFSEAARGRNAARRLDSSAAGPTADISDWMDKGGAGTGSSGGSAAPGSRGFGVSIPRMAAKGAGLGSAGGAGTKSSAGLSRFGSGGDSGNVAVSKAGDLGARGPGSKNAALSSLRNSQAYLGDALKSSSAMEAKAKWGQSFGMGDKGGGEALAYSKSSLAKLDAIKSGEITNLKTNDLKSLKIPDVGAPEKVKSSEAENAALDKMKEDAKAGLTNPMFGSMAGALGANKGGTGAGRNSTPPPEITQLGNLPKPEGQYCPTAEGCRLVPDNGSVFKDNAPTFQQNPAGGWQATYEGQQTGPDGRVTYYKDIVPLNPGGNPQFGPPISFEGASSNGLMRVAQ